MKPIGSGCLLALAGLLTILPASGAVAQQVNAIHTLVPDLPYKGSAWAVSPNGRFLVQSTGKETFAYDLATHQSTKVLDVGDTDLDEVVLSPKGDRIAWSATVQGGESYIWSMPIDPESGGSRGPAQRVTIHNSWGPVFSTDGQWIAFTLYGPTPVRVGQGWSVAVVPATGGPERIVLKADNFAPKFWSADGRSLFVQTFALVGPQKILKVRVNDGTSELVRSGPERIVAMTPGRQELVLAPPRPTRAGDSATVIDTSGNLLGRVPLPVGTWPGGILGFRGDSALVIRASTSPSHMVIEIRPMGGGAPRRVPLLGESNSGPQWSPDGKQIAFVVRQGEQASLGLMNADGSGSRIILRELTKRSDQSVVWSPDSRYLGFVSADNRVLRVFDVVTRTMRLTFQPPESQALVGSSAWRPDSRAITYFAVDSTAAAAAGRSLQRASLRLDEVTLDGIRQHLAFDARAVPGTLERIWLVDRSTVWLRSDSGVFVLSADKPGARRLGDVEPGTVLMPFGVTPDHKWIGGLLMGGGAARLEVTSLESGARRVVNLPGAPLPMQLSNPRLTPDGQTVMVFGRDRGDTTQKSLYAIPLDGGALRVVANLGRFPGGTTTVSISPDGKSIAYSLQSEEGTVSLITLDLRPVLARAGLRRQGP
jgi:Tol biopolymer transport system component